MANTKAKRSIRKKQSTHRPRHAGVFDNRLSATTKRPTQRFRIGSAAKRKFVQFPEIEGKTVETVELLTAPDYHTISINFRDKTCLHFSIETGFTVRTDYSDWKTGEQRILRKWPMIRSYQPSAVSDQQESKSRPATNQHR